MTRRALAALALGAAGLSWGCKSREVLDTCHAEVDRSVVACVADDRVTAAEAQAYVREPIPVAGSATVPDVRTVAVDAAVRTHLFAGEAQRRKLAPPAGAPPVAAAFAQALIADELARQKITRDAVPDDAARRYFDEHPEAFAAIDDFRMQAIVVADAKAAERVYADALGSDEAKFAALAQATSIDEPSKKNGGDFGWIHAGPEADPALLSLGLTLRRRGAVGGPVRAKDGRYFVIRLTEVPLEHKAGWDDVSRAKAKNLIVAERRAVALERLTASLRASTRVRIFDDAVAALSPLTNAQSR